MNSTLAPGGGLLGALNSSTVTLPADVLFAANSCLSCSARAQLQAASVATCSNGMLESIDFGHEQASLLGFASLSSFEHYTSFVTLTPLTILLVVYAMRLCSGRAALARATSASNDKIIGVITTYRTEETIAGGLLFLASLTFLSIHLTGIGLPQGMLRWGPNGTPNTVFSLYAILGLVMVDWSIVMVARGVKAIGRDAFMIYKGVMHLAISIIYGIMYSWLPEAQNGVATIRVLGVTAMVASSLVYTFFIPYELWVFGSDRGAIGLLEVMNSKNPNVYNGLAVIWRNHFPGWYAYSRNSAYLTIMHEKNIGAMTDLVFMAGVACQYAGSSKNHHWLQFALIDNYHCASYKILFVAAAAMGLALFVYTLSLLCIGEGSAYVFCCPNINSEEHNADLVLLLEQNHTSLETMEKVLCRIQDCNAVLLLATLAKNQSQRRQPQPGVAHAQMQQPMMPIVHFFD